MAISGLKHDLYLVFGRYVLALPGHTRPTGTNVAVFRALRYASWLDLGPLHLRYIMSLKYPLILFVLKK